MINQRMSNNSKMVETVNLNLEDLNESFLTCPACLGKKKIILVEDRLR